MGGIENLRGVAFQHASTLLALIELLEDCRAGSLLVEGQEDIVDYELLDVDGRRIRVVQAKTRSEPYVFWPRDLWDLLRQWAALEAETDTDFELHTDGQLSASASRTVALCLERFHRTAETLEDSELVTSEGISCETVALRNTHLRTRMGSASALLSIAGARLRRILELTTIPTAEAVDNIINRLYTRCALAGSGPSQLISRSEAAALVGVALSDIDHREAWSDEVVNRVRAAVNRSAETPDPLILNAIRTTAAAALRLTVKPISGADDKSKVTDLLDVGSCALVGPAGAGKSTALAVLRQAAAAAALPVMLSAKGHQEGTLLRRVRMQLEYLAGVRLSTSAEEFIRSRQDLILLIDGAGDEPVSIRDGLFSDITELVNHNPSIKVIVTGREPTVFASWPVEVYKLIGLGHSERAQIAAGLLGTSSEGVCRAVEDALGETVDNPLLFVMALSVASSASPPRGRVAIYEQFITGLCARRGTDLSMSTRTVFGRAALTLIGQGRRSAGTYEWQSLFQELIEETNAEGGLRRGVAAEQSFQELRGVGLLQADEWGQVSCIHDSFADFFAADAIIQGNVGLPRELTVEFEEVLVFVADRRGVDTALGRVAAQDPLVAARIAGLDRRPWDENAVTELSALLAPLCRTLGEEVIGSAQGIAVCVWRDDVVVAVGAGGNRFVGPSAFDELANDASLVLAVRLPAGPLRVAVELWALLFVRAVDELRPAERPLEGIPSDADMLAAAIQRYELAFQAAVRRLASLASFLQQSRIVALTGGTGFDGVLGAPEPDPMSGGSTHPLHYKRGTEHTTVTVGGTPLRDAAYATAEWHIDGDPWLEAAKEVFRVIADTTAGVVRL